MFDAQDCDIFDVLAHISFNTDLKKRIERVAHVKWTSILFQQYEDLNAKDFLEFLLNQYAQHGVWEIGNLDVNNTVSLVLVTKVVVEGNITNVVIVNTSTYEPNKTNNEANNTTVANPVCDLEIIKLVNASRVYENDLVEWT